MQQKYSPKISNGRMSSSPVDFLKINSIEIMTFVVYYGKHMDTITDNEIHHKFQ
jgi:hypothetical protein